MAQLKLPEAELQRLAYRIKEDFAAAKAQHEERMEKMRDLWQRWRVRYDPQPADEAGKSNFRVPMLQWYVFQLWARDFDSLMGDDAEIIAKPTGPSDQRNVDKIGRYMTWRVFDSMNATKGLAVFTFRRRLFGRSIAYTPWWQEIDPCTGEVYEDRPGFFPLWPDDLVVPAENVDSIQKFSFVVRKYRANPDALLANEGVLYQGIRKNWAKIVKAAEEGTQRDVSTEPVQADKDEAEGVLYEGTLSPANTLWVWEWYGYWRSLKKQDKPVPPRHLVVRILPDVQLNGRDGIIGVQDLEDIRPGMQSKRPFVEASMVYDGSYWPSGTGEQVSHLEDEESSNHNLMTEGGERASSPSVFYKPGEGWDPQVVKLEPGKAFPTTDPSSIREVKTSFDPNGFIIKSQAIEAIGEKTTGLSSFGMGRSSDRPNEPRTATGQIAMVEQGNIRLSGLDVRFLREDMRQILSDIWELDCRYAPAELFFRVSEEDAKGLNREKGMVKMTKGERAGKYDFDIRFASSVWSREAKKQAAVETFTLDLQNPIVNTNPKALWAATNKFHKAMGDDNFADTCPEPSDMERPKKPKEEWTLILQGEDVTTNPEDNDELHVLDHIQRLQETTDQPAQQAMAKHIDDHQKQKAAKVMMSAMAERMAAQIQQRIAGNAQVPGAVASPATPTSGTGAPPTAPGAPPTPAQPPVPEGPLPDQFEVGLEGANSRLGIPEMQ